MLLPLLMLLLLLLLPPPPMPAAGRPLALPAPSCHATSGSDSMTSSTGVMEGAARAAASPNSCGAWVGARV